MTRQHDYHEDDPDNSMTQNRMIREWIDRQPDPAATKLTVTKLAGYSPEDAWQRPEEQEPFGDILNAVSGPLESLGYTVEDQGVTISGTPAGRSVAFFRRDNEIVTVRIDVTRNVAADYERSLGAELSDRRPISDQFPILPSIAVMDDCGETLCRPSAIPSQQEDAC